LRDDGITLEHAGVVDEAVLRALTARWPKQMPRMI
jgi:hypothetical protein